MTKTKDNKIDELKWENRELKAKLNQCQKDYLCLKNGTYVIREHSNREPVYNVEVDIPRGDDNDVYDVVVEVMTTRLLSAKITEEALRKVFPNAVVKTHFKKKLYNESCNEWKTI